MFRLFYISAATRFAKGEELNEILSASRARNRANGVTSLLLYYDGSFAQLLEGPKDAVLRTYQRIESDERHSGCSIILQEDATERLLQEWDFAFVPVSKLAAAERYDFIALDRFHASPQYAALTKHKILKSFLKSFKALAPEKTRRPRHAPAGAPAAPPSLPKAKPYAVMRSVEEAFTAANENIKAPATPRHNRWRPRLSFNLFSITRRTR